ncbi:hypothetical protein ACFL1X_05385 [Candidatus Hydrogenedentota bacterium]
MTIYVVVETFQGITDEIRVFLTEESAQKAEQDWLKTNGIANDNDREAKSKNGIGILLRECELKP